MASLLKRSFSEKIFIRNAALPVCSNCVHFIEPTHNYPYDPIPSNDEGRCKKFGEVSLVTGAVEHDLASHCRFVDKKCGVLGSYYILKKNKILSL